MIRIKTQPVSFLITDFCQYFFPNPNPTRSLHWGCLAVWKQMIYDLKMKWGAPPIKKGNLIPFLSSMKYIRFWWKAVLLTHQWDGSILENGIFLQKWDISQPEPQKTAMAQCNSPQHGGCTMLILFILLPPASTPWPLSSFLRFNTGDGFGTNCCFLYYEGGKPLWEQGKP